MSGELGDYLRKWPWLILRYYPSIRLEGMRNAMRTSSIRIAKIGHFEYAFPTHGAVFFQSISSLLGPRHLFLLPVTRK
jgi:hypothetical protein